MEGIITWKDGTTLFYTFIKGMFITQDIEIMKPLEFKRHIKNLTKYHNMNQDEYMQSVEPQDIED